MDWFSAGTFSQGELLVAGQVPQSRFLHRIPEKTTYSSFVVRAPNQYNRHPIAFYRHSPTFVCRIPIHQEYHLVLKLG